MRRVLEKIDNVCFKLEKVSAWGGVAGAFILFAAVWMIFYAVFVRYGHDSK